MRVRRFLFLLTALSTCAVPASGGQPEVKDLEWENACGGSNIRVTRVDGRIVTINAEVEHFSEGRQWVCHFTDGKVVSALYRQFTVTREAAEQREGAFTTEQHDDFIKTFHFPDHALRGMDKKLMTDLQDVIAKVNAKS